MWVLKVTNLILIGLSAVVALYGTMLVAYSAWAQLRMDRLHDLD